MKFQFSYIENIFIGRNGLGDKGAASIAHALQQQLEMNDSGPWLKLIDVSSNAIGKEGGRRLIESIRKTSLRKGIQSMGKSVQRLLVSDNRLEKEQEKTLKDLGKIRDLAQLYRKSHSSRIQDKK